VVTVLAVGDVLVNREQPDSMFAFVAETIRSSDISFCQLETNYSELGSRSPHARLPMRAHPRNAPALKGAGFDVVSFTSNHALDWGLDAFVDTIKTIESIGIKIIGVGLNIEEARKPLILDVRGSKVAFLAYGSILPAGYWAESDKPGCTPLRAWTLYEQVEMDQPGTPPRIHTFAHEGDKAFMIEDVKRTKADSDIVIVSMHWGIHFTEAEIASYQKEAAHAAIDAGADAVIGHHSHILKPIETYRGKPIFYSLGNFVFDQNFSKDTKRGLLVEVVLEGVRIVDVIKREVAFSSDYHPYFLK